MGQCLEKGCSLRHFFAAKCPCWGVCGLIATCIHLKKFRLRTVLICSSPHANIATCNAKFNSSTKSRLRNVVSQQANVLTIKTYTPQLLPSSCCLMTGHVPSIIHSSKTKIRQVYYCSSVYYTSVTLKPWLH